MRPRACPLPCVASDGHCRLPLEQLKPAEAVGFADALQDNLSTLTDLHVKYAQSFAVWGGCTGQAVGRSSPPPPQDRRFCEGLSTLLTHYMAGAFPDEPGAPPGAGSLNMFRDDSLHQKRQVRS